MNRDSKQGGYKRTFAAVLTIAALSVFTGTLVKAAFFSPDSEGPPPPSTLQTVVAAPGDYPERMQIPSLAIDAFVRHVGVNASGNMATPGNFTDVAWYKYGTVPGFTGSAVIDGHVDNGLSLPGVFKHLGDIKIGDDIYIVKKDGTKLHFIVSDIQSYPYKSVPLQQLFARSDAAWLNLVTCEGKWIKGDKTYDQRLVIYSRLVS